jgi:hypothetical protein
METPDRDPSQRTEWNVRDSNAVLVLFDRRGLSASGGTQLAMTMAARYGRPCLCLNIEDTNSVERASEWMSREKIYRLNVAGPRESEVRGIGERCRRFMLHLIA